MSTEPTAAAIIDVDDPPVTEVALSIQFGSPSADLFDVASLSTRLRDEFPNREEQPPLGPINEKFGAPSPADAFQIEVVDRPPIPRIWLLSDDGARLVQVQHDRVALNWRKRDEGDEYPRYERLRDAFLGIVNQFDEVLRGEGKDALQPNWTEVTYVNHIGPENGELPSLAEIVSFIEPAPEGGVLPPPEDEQVGRRYLLTEDGVSVGRLMLTVLPAIRRSDGEKIWSLTLVSRLQPSEPTIESAFERLDGGHVWSVHAFRELMSTAMHKKWGMRGASGEGR